jgi:tetratricopeptide (TPR) repeat protein
MRPGHTIALGVLFAALLACSGPGAQQAGAAASQAHLDGGNARFAAGDHEGALARYRAAAESDSTNAAAWYGIHMAGTALGDSALADQALARVRQLAPDAGPLDQHHPRPLPPGHPPTGGRYEPDSP